MSRLPLLIFFLLFTENLAVKLDETPRKNNVISNYLNKALDKVFAEMSQTNLSIPKVDLGDDVGRFTDVKGSILGELTKKMDGVGQWGFKLDVNVSEIVVGGNYDLVYLDLPQLFPFFGKGRFLITVGAVNLKMQLNAGYDFNKDGFNIDIPKLDIVAQNSKVRFENLMNDPSLADFLNELISNLIPDLITMLTPPILEGLKPAIDELGNGILLCIKKELISGKIDQCIRDLFVKSTPTMQKTIYEGLTAALKKELDKFGASPPAL